MQSKIRSADNDESFTMILNLCRQANTPGYKFISHALQHDCATSPLEKITRITKEKPVEATKYETYKTQLNPQLTQYPVYINKMQIPDFKRQAFTKLRLMSHNLKIEVGRWSRTPAELRLCSCDGNAVQFEEHVLLYCPVSEVCRKRHTM